MAGNLVRFVHGCRPRSVHSHVLPHHPKNLFNFTKRVMSIDKTNRPAETAPDQNRAHS
jgi:hypothetical protein